MDKDNNTEIIDIELTEILSVLWAKRRIIYTAMLVSLMIGLIYVLCLKPLYRSKTAILPLKSASKVSMIMALGANDSDMLTGTRNLSTNPLTLFSPNDPFTLFVDTFDAPTTKQRFLDYYQSELLMASDGEKSLLKRKIKAFKSLQHSVSISRIGPDANPQYELSFESRSPLVSSVCIDDYLLFANNIAYEKFKSRIQAESSTFIQILSSSLQTQRLIAKQKKLKTIMALRDAMNTAHRVALKQPSSALALNHLSLDMDTSSDDLLYLLGETILKAKLDSLSERQSEEDFDNSIADLKMKQLALKSAIENFPKRLKLFQLESGIHIQVESSHRHKWMTMLLFTLAGTLIAAMIIVLLYSAKDRKRLK